VEQNKEACKQKEARKRRQILIVLLTFGAVLAGASLLLRVLTAGKYEIQTIDLIFLVIPLLVVALVQGKLRSLDLFGLKVDFADLWAAVGQTEIRDQVSGSTLLDAVKDRRVKAVTGQYRRRAGRPSPLSARPSVQGTALTEQAQAPHAYQATRCVNWDCAPSPPFAAVNRCCTCSIEAGIGG
jgi:hypothetical protein